MQSENKIKVVVDPFCYRQFNKDGNTSNYIDCSIEEMQNHVNSLYDQKLLKDGYAPFCKHLFIKNFTQAKLGILQITQENEHLIKTEYEARTEKELAVLRRYFPQSKVQEQVAEFLDIILYSKEQVQIENAAMKNTDPNAHIPYEYGIVSVKPQSIDYEIPMDPITQMRNHLGVEFGGSGVKLNAEKYKESVDFWSKNVIIK